MAEQSPETKENKRRLKAPRKPVQTVRQRQASIQANAVKRQSKVGKFFRVLGTPFRTFAGLGIWQSKGWKPFRFIGKVIGYIVWPRYFRNSFRELRLVTWPSWRESWRLTFAVLGFAIVFGLVIAGVDFGLDKLFKEVLLK